MKDDYVTKGEFEDAMGMINRSFDKVATRDELTSQLAPIKQDLSGLKNDVSGLKQDNRSLKQDVATLKQDVSGLKQDVSDLKADMGYVKDKLNTIGNMMQQFLEKFSDIPERVARLERDRWG